MKEKEQHAKAFRGIWIPKIICNDITLTSSDKILLAEIDSLDQGKGCFASDEYLASIMRVKKQAIKMRLVRLRKRGLLITRKFDGRRRWMSVFYAPEVYETNTPEVYETNTPEVYETNTPETRRTIAGRLQTKDQTGHGGRLEISLENSIANRYSANKELAGPLSGGMDEWKRLTVWHTPVTRFYRTQRQQFPTIIRTTPPKLLNDSAATCNKLCRLDGFTPEQVRAVLEWAPQDEFWARNVLSICSLRSRSKNGCSKFQNILAAMARQTPLGRAIGPGGVKPPGGGAIGGLPGGLDPLARLKQLTAANPKHWNEPMGQFEALKELLGTFTLGPSMIANGERELARQVLAVYDLCAGLPTLPAEDEEDPDYEENKEFNLQHSFSRLWETWLSFLNYKQANFPLRNLLDLRMDRVRWQEMIRDLEQSLHRSFVDGRPV